MDYQTRCATPLGPVTLASDGRAVTELWFVGQKHYAPGLAGAIEMPDLALFDQVRQWLARYFARRDPGPVPPVRLMGTAFQQAVWTALTAIPYGQTRTYSQIAQALGTASPRAVGGAVGRNPVSILVPCHRVVGASGRLTGYAGGLERKLALLELEGAAGLSRNQSRSS